MKGGTFVSMTINVDSHKSDAKITVEGMVIHEGECKTLKRILPDNFVQRMCGKFLVLSQEVSHVAPCIAFTLAECVAEKCGATHVLSVVPYCEVNASVLASGWHQQFLCTLR